MHSILKRSSRTSILTHHRPKSSSPPSDSIAAAAAAAAAGGENNLSRSHVKWISGAAVIVSGLGFWYWFQSPEIDLSFFKKSFVDGSTRQNLSGQRKPSLPENDNSSNFLLSDSFRRKFFFNYEKRMRLSSPPEKVFQYFASSRSEDGELLMKPADLMRAVVPVFPPSESNLVRDGYLTGERNPGELRCPPSLFFMLFDMDKDGLISFKEYIFFVTLLGIPESSFSVAFKMFDTDNNREIDREEFKKVMALMRAQNRQGASHRNGRRTGLKVNGSVENGGLVEYFFGKDGKTRLKHDKFVQFMRDLHDEILNLEFAHYDYKSRGNILAKDFALSIVAAADMSNLSQLLKRVETLNTEPRLKDVRITPEEFKEFAELRNKLQPFSFALFSYGKVNGFLTRDDFKRAASHVCGVSLTDNVVEIIFHIFDKNNNGTLSTDEFLRVLHNRQRDVAQHVKDTGIMEFFSRSWNRKSDTEFLS